MDQQTDVQALLARGDTLLQEERIPEAAAEYARVAQADPSAVGGHLGLAQTNLALGQYGIVSMACQQVNRLAPGSADAALADALQAVVARNYDAALENLERSIDLDPTRAYTHALRAWVLRRLNRNYDAALAEARAARISGKRDWEALFPRVERAAVAPVAAMQPTPAPYTPPGQQGAYAAPRSWEQRGQLDRQMTRFRFLTRGMPVVTYALIIINIVMFGLEVLPGIRDVVLTYGILDDQAIRANPLNAYRLVTSMFLHRDIVHVLLNMVSLYFVGVITERLFGSGKFTLIYFVSGVIGGLTQFGFDIAMGHPGTALGASGAIFGIFGAFGAFILMQRRALGPAANSIIGQWFFWLAINIYFSLSLPQIAIYDHLGGIVAGLILGVLLAPGLARRR